MKKTIVTHIPIISSTNKKLSQIIGEDLPILKKVKKFTIKSGGKRIRPLTHYYFTQMLGYKGKQWCDIGAIGELIHAASLLHDDVVDEAVVRRGKPSINALHGNATSVLSGDYLLACGLDHLCGLDKSIELIGVFTRVLKSLSIGELLQMKWEQDWKLDLKTYQKIINGKTGSLFGAMTQSAYIISNVKTDNKTALAYRNFGEKMGRLFQIRDDYLDYFSGVKEEGKERFQDYKRGLITKPIIVLRDKLSIKRRGQLKKVFMNEKKRKSKEGSEFLEDVLEEASIQKYLAQEVEQDIHSLMKFLREHDECHAQEMMIEQLRKLQVPTNL